jgi:hypothetical protein
LLTLHARLEQHDSPVKLTIYCDELAYCGNHRAVHQALFAKKEVIEHQDGVPHDGQGKGERPQARRQLASRLASARDRGNETIDRRRVEEQAVTGERVLVRRLAELPSEHFGANSLHQYVYI